MVLFCQHVGIFYLLEWENPKAAFLTQKRLARKVLRKPVVPSAETSNSLKKPDSRDVSPNVSPLADSCVKILRENENENENKTSQTQRVRGYAAASQ